MTVQKNTDRARRSYEDWHIRRAQDQDDSQSVLQTPWNVFAQNHLQSIQGKKILEIACGRGQLSSVLAKRGASVIAGDFSLNALEVLKKERSHPGIFPLNADACCLPLKSASVDILVSCETIEHVAEPVQALKEYRRVLKQDGFLLLTCPSYLNTYGLYRIYLKMRGRPYNSGSLIQPLENWLFSFQVKKWLRAAGFTQISHSGTGHYSLWPGKMPKNYIPMNESHWLNRVLKPFALHSLFTAGKNP